MGVRKTPLDTVREEMVLLVVKKVVNVDTKAEKTR